MNSQLQQHPLSAAFPAMADDDYQALCDSIASIGVQNPITVYEGMVIDGWHRYRAANDAGVDCPQTTLEDWIDPRDFVLAQNKARRHITQAQLALATAAVYQWDSHGGDRKSGSKGTGCPLKSSAEIAEIAGVSERTIKQAKEVQSKAEPEVVAAVQRGDIGLRKAAAIAKLPQAEQVAAISKPIIKAKPEPEPQETALDDAADAIRHLAEENEQLRARVAVAAMEGTEEEKAEAADTIAMLRDQVRVLEIELEAVKTSRDTFQSENAELKKQVQRLMKQLKRD